MFNFFFFIKHSGAYCAKLKLYTVNLIFLVKDVFWGFCNRCLKCLTYLSFFFFPVSFLPLISFTCWSPDVFHLWFVSINSPIDFEILVVLCVFMFPLHDIPIDCSHGATLSHCVHEFSQKSLELHELFCSVLHVLFCSVCLFCFVLFFCRTSCALKRRLYPLIPRRLPFIEHKLNHLHRGPAVPWLPGVQIPAAASLLAPVCAR